MSNLGGSVEMTMGSWEESKLRFRRVREILGRAQQDARLAVANADSRAEKFAGDERHIDLADQRRQELRRERERLSGSSRRVESGLRSCARSMLATAEKGMRT